jgi:hypothetical protein
VSKLGIEWDRCEKSCLTRQLKLNISDVDLNILKVSRKNINLNKSILEFLAVLEYLNLRTKSQPIEWTSNYFGVEKHFSTHACLFYKSIKQNTKTEKEAAKLF